MEKETASRIIDHILLIEQQIGKMDEIVFAMPDCDEKKAFINGLGEILMAINSNFVFKITKRFPDLDPDKGKVFPWPPPSKTNK